MEDAQQQSSGNKSGSKPATTGASAMEHCAKSADGKHLFKAGKCIHCTKNSRTLLAQGTVQLLEQARKAAALLVIPEGSNAKVQGERVCNLQTGECVLVFIFSTSHQ